MPDRLLRHVVLFSFKETATSEQVQEIERAFCALPAAIPDIHAFEWGTDVSIENASQGFSHCFLVTFLSEADRNAYLPHPAHQAFGAVLQPHVAKVLVFDYWAESAAS
jgi:hypothetical protein